ncbi:MAG TPA: plastocyanin/azurin family copper-binding protein [Gemmatimonadaceae bacterium]|nr:plastocyanin/azurin family copper-binding protein [Gemmatimonadaceae bacterium]
MRPISKYVVVLSVLAAAACGGGGGDSTTGPGNPGNPGNPGGPSTSPQQTSSVTVGNNLFSPASIQVPVGTTVTWTWDAASITHNVTFADGSGSGNKAAGATFTRTFGTAGTFQYQCTLHAGMTGSVLVQ